MKFQFRPTSGLLRFYLQNSLLCFNLVMFCYFLKLLLSSLFFKHFLLMIYIPCQVLVLYVDTCLCREGDI